MMNENRERSVDDIKKEIARLVTKVASSDSYTSAKITNTISELVQEKKILLKKNKKRKINFSETVLPPSELPSETLDLPDLDDTDTLTNINLRSET